MERTNSSIIFQVSEPRREENINFTHRKIVALDPMYN
jgi:hypothetical protein